PCGLGDVAVAPLDDAADVPLDELVERGGAVAELPREGVADGRRDRAIADHAGIEAEHEVAERVLELADVARPPVRHRLLAVQPCLDAPARLPEHRRREEAVDEVTTDAADVLGAIAERRQADHRAREALVE